MKVHIFGTAEVERSSKGQRVSLEDMPKIKEELLGHMFLKSKELHIFHVRYIRYAGSDVIFKNYFSSIKR